MNSAMLSHACRTLVAPMLGAILVASPVAAQHQAAHIGFLTTPADREGSRGSSKQWRAVQPLEIPNNMRIEPPFAWNRTDRYEPPHYEEFFPDDPQGGKQLDKLFQGKLGGHHAPEDVLAAVRQGLRHTKVYTSQILAQVGNGFVWGVKEQDPRALELLYHASDVRSGHAHNGMYYGLCVLEKRTPNVIRTMMDNYTRYGGSIQGRIHWGLRQYGDREETTRLLEDLLCNPQGLSDNGVVSALDVYRKFTGRRFDDAGSLADRGLFVVGLTHRHAGSPDALRQQFIAWIDQENRLEGFVIRRSEGQQVGVGLVRGIGNRDAITRRVDADEGAELLFAETFAPVVLQSRQLREFAPKLEGGLPERAKPRYAPIPDNESFAWNDTERYRPPDFMSYFPDDPAASKQLDELFENRETTNLTARQQLELVRRGLRHTTVRSNSLMDWVSGIAGWPDDPMAKEILYHAADPRAPQQTRYNAIYFGLSGWWDRPPNVLRMFADILLSEPFDRSLGSGTIGRITWSLRDEAQKRTVAEHLEKGLRAHDQYSPEKLANLTTVYEQLAGEKPAAYEQYKDRGKFFVGFRVKRSPSAEHSKQYVNDLLGTEAYWIDTLVLNPKKGVLVIVQGLDGLQQAVEKLQADGGASLDMAGPLGLFKDVDPKDDAAEWLVQIKKYLDH